MVVITDKIMRMLTAEEHTVALLNLAVPSPIFRETEPILLQLKEESVRERVRFGVYLRVSNKID